MAKPRSSRPDVRNPVLALPAMRELRAFPLDIRTQLARVLDDLGRDAAARADKAWVKHKGPMAAYWRGVSVYSRHTSRAIRLEADHD